MMRPAQDAAGPAAGRLQGAGRRYSGYYNISGPNRKGAVMNNLQTFYPNTSLLSRTGAPASFRSSTMSAQNRLEHMVRRCFSLRRASMDSVR